MKQSIYVSIAVGGAILFLGVGFLVGYAVHSGITYVDVQEAQVTKAVCSFKESDVITGNVTITQEIDDDFAHIVGNLNGADGEHAFHIHQYGNLGDGCVKAGGHYNPFNMEHGAPIDQTRHVGDLGNIQFRRGNANFNMVDREVKLRGDKSVVGRAFVIHDLPDDMGVGGKPDSRKTGAAGRRIACCVIGMDHEHNPIHS